MAIDLYTQFQINCTTNTNGNVANVIGLATYTVDVQLGGAGAVVNFEGQASDVFLWDGKNCGAVTWRSVAGIPSAGGSRVTNTNADGLWFIPCSGLSQVRARVSANNGAGNINVQGYGCYGTAVAT